MNEINWTLDVFVKVFFDNTGTNMIKISCLMAANKNYVLFFMKAQVK